MDTSWQLPKPKCHLLVACDVDTVFSVNNTKRTYDVRWSPKNWYYSSMSGGQRCFTDENQGVSGEPIEGRTLYYIAEAGHFDNWIDVCYFLQQMKAKNIETLEYGEIL